MEKNSRLSRRQFVASAASTALLGALSSRSTANAQARNLKGDSVSTTLTPYLLLNGSCAQAMEFYQSVFGGELSITQVKDSSARDHMPSFQQERETEEPDRGDLGVGLAAGRSDSGARKHGLPFPEWGNGPGLEGSFRQAFRWRGRHRSLDGTVLWLVWGAERQVRREMDVCNQCAEQLACPVSGCTRQDPSLRPKSRKDGGRDTQGNQSL